MSNDDPNVSSFSAIKALLAAAITVVVALLAAFGGFLTEIAPPKVPDAAGQSSAIGIASFLALILLLLIQYGVSHLPTANWARVALGAAVTVATIVFIITALNYKKALDEKSFAHVPLAGGEPVRHTIGSRYTKQAEDFLKTHSISGPEDFMQEAGTDNPLDIWTRESVLETQGELTTRYQILIVSLCVALFPLAWISIKGVPIPGKRARK